MSRVKRGTPVVPVRIGARTLARKVAEVLNRARYGGQITEVTNHGKRAAMVIPPELYDRIPADVLAEFKAAA